jgi:hypothetical protein
MKTHQVLIASDLNKKYQGLDFSSIFNVSCSSITNDNATKDATSNDATSGGSSRRHMLDGFQL